MPEKPHLDPDLLAFEQAGKTIHDGVAEYLESPALFLVPQKEDLAGLIPQVAPHQQRFSADPLPGLDEQEVYIGDLPSNKQDPEKREKLHYDSGSFETVVSVAAKRGYFQRAPIFMEVTRLTQPGGTILSLTGLLPDETPYHDFKGWVPSSNKVDLEQIHVFRHQDHQTPRLMTRFSRGSAKPDHEDGTVIDSPTEPEQAVHQEE